MIKRFALVAAIALATPVAFCGDLATPFSMDSASVLPKGVRNIRLTGLTTGVDDKFSSGGVKEPLAQSMNKAISYNDLMKSVSASERSELKYFLERKGVDANTSVGFTQGVVNSRVTVAVPTMAYGATEKVTVAVAVPIIKSDVNIAYGWTANDEIPKTFQRLIDDNQVHKIPQYQPKLDNVVRTEFLNKGYTLPEDQQKTQIGDVTLVAKYQVLKQDLVTVAVQPRVVTPTGRRADINNIADVGGGDGQWDMGVAAITELRASNVVSFTGAVGYLAQLPARVPKRVPRESGETLTPDVDGSTRMDLGDVVSSSLGMRLSFAAGVTAGAAGVLQYKGLDKYSGGRFASERYEWMSKDTEQYMESAQITLGYSTLPLFMAKQFPVPLEASLTHSIAFAGRNVKKADVTALELAVYF